MRLTEISYRGQPPVDGYGPGFFRVAEVRIDGPVLILPGGVESWGGFEDLGPVLAQSAALDVLFLGMGREVAHAPQKVRTALEGVGLAFDVMPSPAACRTYNVLLSEGRRVGLAALPVLDT